MKITLVVSLHSAFLTTFLNKKEFFAFTYIFPDIKGAIARSLFYGNLLRVLRLTRYDLRGKAEKPSRGAAESGRNISSNEKRL